MSQPFRHGPLETQECFFLSFSCPCGASLALNGADRDGYGYSLLEDVKGNANLTARSLLEVVAELRLLVRARVLSRSRAPRSCLLDGAAIAIADSRPLRVA